MVGRCQLDPNWTSYWEVSRQIARFSRHLVRRLNKELKKDPKCTEFVQTFLLSSRAGFPWISYVGEKRRRGDLLTCWSVKKYWIYIYIIIYIYIVGSNKRWQGTPLPWRWQYPCQQQQQQQQKRKLKQGPWCHSRKEKKNNIFSTRTWSKQSGLTPKNRRHTHTHSDRDRNIEVIWSGNVDKSSWQCLRHYSASFGSCHSTGNSITSRVFKCAQKHIETASEKDPQPTSSSLSKSFIGTVS